MNRRKTSPRLENILADKISGSSELLEQLNIFLLKNLNQIPDKKKLILTLKQHFCSFQIIQKYLEQLSLAINSKQLSDNFFAEFRLKSQTIYDRIFNNALTYLENKKSILTISNSTTVFEILSRLKYHHKFETIICESRPKLEGRILARRLIKVNIGVKLIIEAMTVNYIKECDCVIIGADTVFKNKSVVNKIGSSQLALLCGHFRKPFYVITEKFKFSQKNSYEWKEEFSGEIWKTAPKGIKIKNIYFEKIDASLISKIITD